MSNRWLASSMLDASSAEAKEFINPDNFVLHIPKPSISPASKKQQPPRSSLEWPPQPSQHHAKPDSIDWSSTFPSHNTRGQLQGRSTKDQIP